ncbi:DNA primase large subunit [Cyanidiococcus yangmingshanensis]|uniref:DNA primase large subunit n=1 Tax=Cyanidiococcus yangmingshanensis TaxID=2690220 RepID=A0A7J7IHZ4_9RHOD|nr:DNA primase large subunit [Cyanidiococcus yangmingshanensis]
MITGAPQMSSGLVAGRWAADASSKARPRGDGLYLTCPPGPTVSVFYSSCTARQSETAEVEVLLDRLLRLPQYRFLQDYPGRADALSHFMLRLAFGQSADLQEWWVQAERLLLRLRPALESLSELAEQFLPGDAASAQRPLIESVSCEKAPRQVFETLRGDGYQLIHEQLKNMGHTGTGNLENMGIPMFKIPFELVLRWVRHRQLWLHAGYAWVPALAWNELVLEWFDAFLRRAGVAAAQRLSIAPSSSRLQERLSPMVLCLRERHQGWMRSRQRQAGTLRSIGSSVAVELHLPELGDAVNDFPLCMRLLMVRLQDHGHLRHQGRLQLGLFLKGAGLTLSESLQFWRESLLGKNEFEREYAYGIRYNYGLEGKRKSCPPFTCARMLEMRPGPGEHHGCPFQELAAPALEQAVRTYLKIEEPEDIEEITRFAASGQPQRACTTCLRSLVATHESSPAGAVASSPETTPVAPRSASGERNSILAPVQHPNDYLAQLRLTRLANASRSEATSDTRMQA